MNTVQIERGARIIRCFSHGTVIAVLMAPLSTHGEDAGGGMRDVDMHLEHISMGEGWVTIKDIFKIAS
jgi:hypothetical protein